MLETAQKLSAAPRAGGSTLAHTWRLALWELFLARRRALSKVLSGIFLAGFALEILIIFLIYAVSSANGAPDSALQPVRDQLTFPKVLLDGGIFDAYMGPLLISILSGVLVGSEYGYSTQRLAFARGVGRGQMLAAQVGALGLISLGTTILSLALSALVGVTLGPAIGGTIAGPAAGGWQEIGTYALVLSLILWAYSLLALFFATLGRSVWTGVGLSLGWLFLEGNVIVPILRAIGFIPGNLTQFLGHIPDWFLGVNTSALKIATGSAPLDFAILDNPQGAVSSGSLGPPNPTALISGTHALLVIIAYGIAFIAVSYWLLRTRDVTD